MKPKPLNLSFWGSTLLDSTGVEGLHGKRVLPKLKACSHQQPEALNPKLWVLPPYSNSL